MKSFLFLAIVFFVSLGQTQVSATDQGFDTLHTCDSYAALESEMRCGPSSYIQKFALPYCLAYLNRAAEFSPSGQVVLEKIRSCLQKELLQDADDGLTCDNIEDIGVASHYNCYIQSGFCNLSSADRDQVMWIAKAQVFNWPVLKVFGRVLSSCDSDKAY